MFKSIEINYHEADYSPLILDCLSPIISDLVEAAEVDRLLLYPNWRGGPHMNLVMDADPADFETRLYPLAAAAICDWIEHNPSRTEIDSRAYQQLSGDMAEIERDLRPLPPLRPNNTVRASQYERPIPLSVPELGEIRDGFLAKTTNTLLAACGLARGGLRARLGAVLPMLLAQATVRTGSDFAFWPLSFVAHGRVFLVNNPQHADRFEKIAKQLEIDLAELISDELDPSGPSNLVPWRTSLRGLDARLTTVVAERFEELDHKIWGQAMTSDRGADNPLGIEPSKFAAFRNETHLTWRIAQNIVYLTLPVIGLSSAERACLGYAIGRTCEVHYPELMLTAHARMQEMLAAGRRRFG